MTSRMTRFLCIRIFCLISLLLPVSGLGLQMGQDPEAVREELGEPNGIRQFANGEIWVYSGDVSLEFEEGRLVRAKGIDLKPAEWTVLSTEEPLSDGDAEAAGDDEKILPQLDMSGTTAGEESGNHASAATSVSNLSPDQAADPMEMHPSVEELPPSTSNLLGTVLRWMVPLFLQYIFLLVAFKWAGAEASRIVLLLIAVVDRLVVEGVRWVFFAFLEFPTTFYADELAAFFVLLALVTKFTYARSLPLAVQVIIFSKVAAWISFWLLTLLILHRL